MKYIAIICIDIITLISFFTNQNNIYIVEITGRGIKTKNIVNTRLLQLLNYS